MDRLKRLAIYLGGFVGPYGAQSLVVVVPDMAETFDIPIDDAAIALSVYTLPFACLMLVSTQLVRKLRPKLVVSTAFLVTAMAALACMFASSWYLFLFFYMLMGLVNAFTLPVLQVMLQRIHSARNLGEALGTYTSMQALGTFSAPVSGGLFSVFNWQMLFLVSIGFSLVIVVIGLPEIEPLGSASSSQERVKFFPLGTHMLTLLVVGMSSAGLSVVFALHLFEHFHLDPPSRGTVVMLGGFASFFLSRQIGRVGDRLGVLKVLVACLGFCAVSLLAIPFVSKLFVLAVAWAVVVVSSQGVQTFVSYIVLRGPRGAMLNSTASAMRTFGVAFSPMVFVGVYLSSYWAAFVLPAVLVLAMVPLQVLTKRSQPY